MIFGDKRKNIWGQKKKYLGTKEKIYDIWRQKKKYLGTKEKIYDIWGEKKYIYIIIMIFGVLGQKEKNDIWCCVRSMFD